MSQPVPASNGGGSSRWTEVVAPCCDDLPVELSRAVFADAWPQVVRALAAETGSLYDGEELAAEAFARASKLSEPPGSLVAWCIAVGRRAGIDAGRRHHTERAHLPELWAQTRTSAPAVDDRVALLFIACDDGLSASSRMVLAMRIVLGIDTDAIAAHLGLDRATAAARLTRAKRTLAKQQGGFRMQTGAQIQQRMPVVLDCVHGMLSIAQRLAIDPTDALEDLAAQAERLAVALVQKRPRDSEARAVLAIIRLALARRPGRVRDGAALAPEDVDRSQWDRTRIAAGINDAVLADDLVVVEAGRFALEARIAALHTAAPTFWAVPWAPITALHSRVETRWPAPSATLSRLVAQGYEILTAAGAARSGRIEFLPPGMKQILKQVQELDRGSRALHRDVQLTLADFEWRVNQPAASKRYRDLVTLLADNAIGSPPMQRFCELRAATALIPPAIKSACAFDPAVEARNEAKIRVLDGE